MVIKLQCLYSHIADCSFHTVTVTVCVCNRIGHTDDDARQVWCLVVSCCWNLNMRLAISMTVRILPLIAGCKQRPCGLNLIYSDWCIFPSSVVIILLASWDVHKLFISFTYRLIRVFSTLSGCKSSSSSSSSSSVWCQQCWLIRAVGRQCVIHSYSWHMYYSPLNTNN